MRAPSIALRSTLLLVLAALGLVGAPSRARSDEDAPARSFPSLHALDLRDPLDRAHAADAVPPADVLAALREGRARDRLRAVHAAPFLAELDLTIPALAPLAASDDPLLAPAAARAALACLDSLGGAELAAQEVSPAPLLETIAAWDALAAEERARADVRADAARVADTLRSLLEATPRGGIE